MSLKFSIGLGFRTEVSEQQEASLSGKVFFWVLVTKGPVRYVFGLDAIVLSLTSEVVVEDNTDHLTSMQQPGTRPFKQLKLQKGELSGFIYK